YPNTTLTNGRTPVFHRFQESRAYSAMALFRPAYSRRSKSGFSNWLDRTRAARCAADFRRTRENSPMTGKRSIALDQVRRSQPRTWMANYRCDPQAESKHVPSRKLGKRKTPAAFAAGVSACLVAG